MAVQRYRPLLRSLYPVGPLIILSAVLEPFLRVAPFRLGEAPWRFGAVGFFSDSVLGVLFGLIWMMGIAAILENRRVLRVVSALSVLMAVFVALVIGAFALDALQLRGTVNPQIVRSFDGSVLKVLLTLTLSVPVALWIGIAGWRSARGSQSTHKVQAPAPEGPLLIHAKPQEVQP